MKTILAFFAAASLAAFASAATHYVDINGHAQYTQVQPAIDAASARDTIIVGPGVGYQGFTVDRRLVIVGAGTSTILTEGTRIDGIVTITGTADSTELQGFWIIASVWSDAIDSLAAVLRMRSGVAGVFVWRCFVENTFSGGMSASDVFLGHQSSAQFTQCAFRASGGSYGDGIWSDRSGWSLTLSSCVIACYYQPIPAATGSGVIQANHCVITSSNFSQLLYLTASHTGFVENSAFLYSGGTPSWSSLGSVTLAYCAANGAAPPGSGNIICSAADFVNLASYDNPRANDYHLSEGSVLRDAGNPSQFDLDSTRADIGIYGGMHPYVDGGVPDYPFVLDLDVPTSVPQNGAVRVYARGRIGPGY